MGEVKRFFKQSALRDDRQDVAYAQGAISVEQVTHSFAKSILAISKTSLQITPHEFVSIVGPSGCGKTTLLNLMAGLLPVQDGKVLLSSALPRAGRSDVAYMLARDSLLPWRTAIENVEFGARMRGANKTDCREKARRLLEQVGLRGFEDAYPKALSHGMRQRVALARTFCLDSQILLMDEPFGALDVQTKLQLADVLLTLWSGERRTVVFITHDLSEAIALSDRVIVMKARPGAIIADIPVDLPRPRSARALQSHRQYHDLYARVWSELESALES